MINRIVYYGVPNKPEMMREHLSHFGFKVTSKRAARISALYNLMLKEPLRWTDPAHSFDNPFAVDLPEYERLGIRAVQKDLKALVESCLVFAYKRDPTMIEMAQSIGII